MHYRSLVALSALVLGATSASLGACSSSTKDNGFGPDGQNNKDDSGATTTRPDDNTFNTEGGTVQQPGVCAPNPLNYDNPGDGCDDDADGIVDNVASCD